MKTILNKEHPHWHHLTLTQNFDFFFKHQFDLSVAKAKWPELNEVITDYFGDYDRAWLHHSKDGGHYFVAELLNGNFGTLVSGPMSECQEEFDDHEDALTATYADWITEAYNIGEWNDEGNEFVVDGLWLIRQEEV